MFILRLGLQSFLFRFKLRRPLYTRSKINNIFTNNVLDRKLIGASPSLWNYFTNRNNLLFLGTNVAAFVGVVTVESLWANKLQKLKPSEEVNNNMLALPLGAAEEFELNQLSKQAKIISPYSKILSGSLFHLIYSFNVYNKSSNERGISLKQFYFLWRNEFSQDFMSDTSFSQAFDIVQPTDPKHRNLLPITKFLQETPLTDIEDVYTLYNVVSSHYGNSSSVKRLLILWLYDYSKFLKGTSASFESTAEEFYDKILRDSKYLGKDIFNKYASVVLELSNPRKHIFFPKYDLRNKPTQRNSCYFTISLKTYTELLNCYSQLHTSNWTNKKIIQLIQLLRENAIKTTNTEVRIMIPDLRDKSINKRIKKRLKQDNSSCLQIIKEDSNLMKVLNGLSEKNK